MTILGLDFGEKNIGLAVGESENLATKPLEVIRRTKDQQEIKAIIALCNKWEVAKIIIGLPLNSEDQETKSSQKVRQFSSLLKKQLALKKIKIEIILHPEQHSTQLSNRGLSRTQKKKLGDAYAAEYILKSYFEQ
jgi:putative Holliday junction resolvase